MDIGVISKWASHHLIIFAVCEYNYDNKIDINVKHSTLAPKRYGDQSIMYASSNYYSLKAELCSINRVCSIHKTISINDICEADGRTLSPVFLNQEEYSLKSNTFRWTIKHKVFKKSFTLLNKFLIKGIMRGELSAGDTIR